MAKKQSKNCATTIAQNSPAHRRQLELFNYTGKRHKPQISSIPGIHPRERNRYQVKLADAFLGTHLTLDQAIALANQSTHL
jgi:hypothetical protein